MGAMKISKGWKAQDLMRREDVLQILTTNLKVSTHPPPDNMAGTLYCVDGISLCADAVMDLLEMRAENKKKEVSENAGRSIRTA